MAYRCPRCVLGVYDEFVASDVPDNCLRGVKWSPDGLCLLTASEDRMLRLFELPGELLESEAGDASAAAAAHSPELCSTLTVRAPDSIYDYAWYPFMDSSNPATCCFASSSRDSPIHLWDAYTGASRASYIPYDHLDEVIAAQSIAFSPSGERLYAGFERAIRVFDVSRPGRECTLRPTCSTRRARDGLRGLISCFAFAPDAPQLFAAGSLAGTIGLYTESSKGLITELRGHTGGVTQCAFSADGVRLYSAARRDGAIQCWDVRLSGRVLATYHRASPTNQKIGFELLTPPAATALAPMDNGADSAGGATTEAVLSASQDGRVLLYAQGAAPSTLLSFAEATSTATLHPYAPLLAVSVGERRYPLLSLDDEAAEEVEGAAGEGGAQRHANGLTIWQLGVGDQRGGGGRTASAASAQVAST
jgi:hypothetical protein